MQETLDAPAQVRDDLPTLRSELGEWWEKHLKPLIDFQSFLRQRHAILTDLEVTHALQPPYDGWKNPFAFALSASTLTFTIVALIGVAFHSLVPDPDVNKDWIARSLQTQLATVKAQLSAGPRAGATHERLMAQQARLMNDLNDHTSAMTVPHEGIILTAGIPLVVYFLGIFFPRFVQRRVPDARYASSAREIVYYYFTARSFWPAFFLVTGGAVYFFLLKYSLLSTYDELPTFPVSRGPLYVLLGAIATLGAIPFCYAFIAIPVTFHKCAHEISSVLGVSVDAHAKHAIYWGLIRSVIVSMILAFTLTVLLVSVYSLLDSGSQSIRTAMAASLSIEPSDRK